MKLHSIVEVITNSSSEIFTIHNAILDEVQEVVHFKPQCKDCPYYPYIENPIEIITRDDNSIDVIADKWNTDCKQLMDNLIEKFGSKNVKHDIW